MTSILNGTTKPDTLEQASDVVERAAATARVDDDDAGTLRRMRRLTRRRHRDGYDVVFYVPWLGPLLTQERVLPTGGAETQIFLVARALAKRGARVCLIVFDVPETSLPRSIDGIAVHVRRPYLAHERFGKIRELVAIVHALARVDARVVVTRSAGPHVGLVGMWAKLLGRQFVYSSANVSDFHYRRSGAATRDRALFDLGVKLADEIVVQTEEQMLLSRTEFDRSATLVKSIAEPGAEVARNPEAFLWIGRIVPAKQPMRFVELARALPDARFWLVGVPVRHSSESEQLLAEVEAAAAELPNLELHRPRPRGELMDLFARAVAVVNTADVEGMPNVFLEGWAYGVPALSLTRDPDGVIERHGLGAFAAGSFETLVRLAHELWLARHAQAEAAARSRAYVAEHHAEAAAAGRWAEVIARRAVRARRR